MIYWTALVITILSGPLNGGKTALIYTSMAECRAAAPVVSNTLHYDHKLECVESTAPTSSPMSKARP
jgi:hypothetical protein